MNDDTTVNDKDPMVSFRVSLMNELVSTEVITRSFQHFISFCKFVIVFELVKNMFNIHSASKMSKVFLLDHLKTAGYFFLFLNTWIKLIISPKYVNLIVQVWSLSCFYKKSHVIFANASVCDISAANWWRLFHETGNVGDIKRLLGRHLKFYCTVSEGIKINCIWKFNLEGISFLPLTSNIPFLFDKICNLLFK